MIDKSVKAIAAQFRLENGDDGHLRVTDITNMIQNSLEEDYGIKGREIDLTDSAFVQLSHAEVVADQYLGKPGIRCRGSNQMAVGESVSDYLRDTDSS